MTAPRADEADLSSVGSGHPARAGAAAPALVILLLLGLVLRLTIAYVLLPGSGFESDMGTFSAWARALHSQGPGEFYANNWSDYPPAYLYALWLGSHVVAFLHGGSLDTAAADWLKLGPILADVAIAFVLFHLVRGWTRRSVGPRADRLGLIAAGLYLFNPVTWYDSAIWGQVDSVGTLVLLLTVAALVRGNSEGATVLAVIGGLVKPQFGVVLGPLVVIVLLRRHLLAPGSGPQHRPWVPRPLRAWFEEERGIWRLLSSATAGLIVLFALLTPFALDLSGLIVRIAQAAAGYQYLSVNAFNPWALIGSAGQAPLALNFPFWSPDNVALLGPLSGMAIGTLLLAAGFGVGLLRVAWRDDRRSLIVGTIFLAFCFFMLPTRVHERYLFPVFALLPILAVVDRRWLVALAALAIASFINLHAVLTVPIWATPNIENAFLGETFREPIWIIFSVLLHAGVFVFVAWQLRPGLVRERADPGTLDLAADLAALELEPGVAPPAGAPAAAARPADPEPAAAPSQAGALLADARRWVEPLVRPIRRPALRRDRSAELAAEGPGRIVRLDLLILLLVFLSALGLRTLRVEQPFHMHFDEVYHARTATEFLQHWRYGMPHGIYEWTHPHLAKYAIAIGIDWLGNNRVTGQRELGTDVRAAALERRWSPGDSAGVRNGDRLYVAGTSEVHAYDLLDRRLVATLPLSVQALAVDENDHALLMAGANGEIWRLSTDQLDGPAAPRAPAGPAYSLMTTVEGLGGTVVDMLAADDTLVVRTSAGELASLDSTTGVLTGRRTISGAVDMLVVAADQRVVVDLEQVDDTAALVDTLATAGRLSRFDLQNRLADRTGRVVVAAYLDEEQTTALADAIEAGDLPGVTMQGGSALALALPAGVELADLISLDQLLLTRTTVPVTGFDLVTQGVDKPTLYAATSSGMQLLKVPSDERPTVGDRLAMPGAVSDVIWNPTTHLVHVLGRTPDGSAATVYVIEPHANAVFADAALPFDPEALIMDAQPRRPADDRLDLLAVSGDGQLATVDVGGNTFAWRFPGVLAGALMAAFIYLLARFLFNRRSVAVMAALLVLLDGMMFANARIAMNDAYVALFIVAAMTLFAPLWLGRWRSRAVVAGGILGVAALLGLALAAKWVGLYAVGGVALLILLRSALGRMVALAAMVALTALLGYMAIAPAAAGGQANYPFLLLMIGLTCAMAVGMAVRPMRLTIEELRLAIIGPLVAGGLALVAGLLLSWRGEPDPDALITPFRLFAAGGGLLVLGVAAFVVARLAAGYGIGPLAEPELVDLNGEQPSPPPPAGWLRPGSGLLGLPWLAALGTLVVVPLAIYVLSFAPWVELGNRFTADFPPDHQGQTFFDLQKGMYDYHNNLRVHHPATSPWWAWPLDLKPVWFEQQDYVGTTGVIYDTGNLVIFWLAIPAFAFVCWQAWRRRSLALSFVVLAALCMWLPWARIDRATFQYHFFTTLPFTIIALAYFLAELWHGPSRRTWLLARAGAAVAIAGPALIWLLRQPLCSIAGVEVANPGSELCGPLSRTATLSNLQVFSVLLTVGGMALIAWLAWVGSGRWPWVAANRTFLLPMAMSLTAAGVVMALVGAVLPGQAMFQIPVSVAHVAFIVLLLFGIAGYYVMRARDPRRFAISALVAATIWFVLWYPNFSGLPVPGPISQVHLGLLPTYIWPFQFAVNLSEPVHGIDLASVVMLGVVMLVLVGAAYYATRVWRQQRLAESADQLSMGRQAG